MGRDDVHLICILILGVLFGFSQEKKLKEKQTHHSRPLGLANSREQFVCLLSWWNLCQNSETSQRHLANMLQLQGDSADVDLAPHSS